MDSTNQDLDALVAFSLGETEQAIRAGGQRKAPGRDGLMSKFYKHIGEISRAEMEIIIKVC